MTDPAALAARIEAATAETQQEVLLEVLISAHRLGWISHDDAGHAIRMLDAFAYESAALVLKPAGHALSLHIDADGTVWVGCMLDTGEGCDNTDQFDLPPAMAIALASVRAWEAREGV